MKERDVTDSKQRLYVNPSDEDRKGCFQQTYTGRRFYVEDPRPEDVFIVDIAHHLAMLVRYNGAVLRYYSVAEHSVHVSRRVSPKNAMWGLLHDASEYVTGDMTRPLKMQPQLRGFSVFENRVQRAVCTRFGLPHDMPAEVKEVDGRITDDERRDLMSNMDVDPKIWGNTLDGFGINLCDPMEWQEAERAFLDRFHELGGRTMV